MRAANRSGDKPPNSHLPPEVDGGVGVVLSSGVGVGVEFAEAICTGVALEGRDWDSRGGSIAQLLALRTIVANAWSIAKAISGVSFSTRMKSFRGRK